MNQLLAVELLKSGFNCVLTGEAGTGKSYTLELFIKYLKSKKINYAVTASTGIAASHLNGVTIHGWSGIGIKYDLNLEELEKIKDSKPYLKDVGTLIIDEISMLHSKQLELLDRVLQYCRDSNEPFGGIQLIVSVDFFQLPPVERGEKTGNKKFCFMSKSWVDANFKVLYLDKQYRQGGDALSNILNEIRNGHITESSKDTLLKTKNNELISDRITQLYTHNINVESINNKELKALEGEEYTFFASMDGTKGLCENIMRQNRISDCFTYKIGSLVMFNKNDPNKAYQNGTCGTIIDVTKVDDEEVPIVKTAKGDIIAEPAEWKLMNGDEVVASVRSIPLRLAWAITVHKSQGMTLDSAKIDLSKTFEKGQAYVALSRLKSLSGMCLLGLNEKAFEIETIICKVDQRFKELSAINDQLYSNFNFKKSHRDFLNKLEKMGAINKYQKPSGYKKYPSKGVFAEKNAKKTVSFIKKGVDLEKLSKRLNLSLTTIFRHIKINKFQDENCDISFLKPTDKVLKIVSEAIKESNKQKLSSLPFFKNNPMYIQTQLCLVKGGKDLSEIEVLKASLFLNDSGDRVN